MISQDGQIAETSVQALNLLTPGHRAHLCPWSVILVFIDSGRASAGYYMSSTHLLLTFTSFFFPAPSSCLYICIKETQGLSSNCCLSSDIVSSCLSSLHEMLALRSWYGPGDGVPDNDTGMTSFLTSRGNSLTQGNLRDSNSLVLCIVGTEHMKVSLGLPPCSVGRGSCSQPEKVMSFQYMSDWITLSLTSSFRWLSRQKNCMPLTLISAGGLMSQ